LNVYKEKTNTCISFIILDITDISSIEKCALEVEKNFGQIDMLINNAGVLGHPSVEYLETNIRFFEPIFNVNFYGTINMTEIFLKKNMIKNNGKIITVTSSAGNAMRLTNNELRKEIISDDVNLEKLYDFAQKYKNAIIKKTFENEGWIMDDYPVYSNSKLLLNAYVKSLKHREEIIKNKIQVYGLCPGWVQTEMGGQDAPRTLDRASIVPMYLVELPSKINENFQGKFFYEKQVFDWENNYFPETFNP